MSLLLFYKSAGATKDLAGTSAASSALTAGANRQRLVAASSANTATHSADLSKIIVKLLAGQSVNAAAFSAAVARSRLVSGTSANSATFTAPVLRQRPIAALLSSTSTWTGNVDRIKPLLGSIAATSAHAGAARVAMAPYFADVSVASLSAGVNRSRRVVGINSNTATHSANLLRQRIIALFGSLNATAASTALITIARPLAGSLSSVSALAGAITNLKPLAGDVAASGTISNAPLLRARDVTGLLATYSTWTAPSTTRLVDLFGAWSGTTNLTSTLDRVVGYTGSLPAQAGLSANLDRALNLAGTEVATSTHAASLSRQLASLEGLQTVVSTLTGSANRARLLETPGMSAVSDVQALLGKIIYFSGESLNTGVVVDATLSVILALAGQIASTSTTTADFLARLRGLNSLLSGTATLTATTLRIEDGVTFVDITISLETWEKVDNSTAILVTHTTDPIPLTLKLDLVGEMVDEVALTGTVVEEQG